MAGGGDLLVSKYHYTKGGLRSRFAIRHVVDVSAIVDCISILYVL